MALILLLLTRDGTTSKLLLSNRSLCSSPVILDLISSTVLTLHRTLSNNCPRCWMMLAIKPVPTTSYTTRDCSLRVTAPWLEREVSSFREAKSKGSLSLVPWFASQSFCSWMKQPQPWMPSLSTKCSKLLTSWSRVVNSTLLLWLTDSQPSSMPMKSSWWRRAALLSVAATSNSLKRMAATRNSLRDNSCNLRFEP